MLLERAYKSSCLMLTVSLPLSVNIYDDTIGRNVHELDLEIYNGPRPNVNIQIERVYSSSYLMAIVVFSSPPFASIFSVEMCIT